MLALPYRVKGVGFELKVKASLVSHLQNADQLPALRVVEANREPHGPFTVLSGWILLEELPPLPLPKVPRSPAQPLTIPADTVLFASHLLYQHFKGRPSQLVLRSQSVWVDQSLIKPASFFYQIDFKQDKTKNAKPGAQA